MQPRTRVVSPRKYRRMPWRNGGGSTTELLRHPASQQDPFLWRVSIAEIRESGPFSIFAGYNRSILLLEGAGVVLHFAGGEQKTLRVDDDFFDFSGDRNVSSSLVSGPVRDFNVICDRRRISGTANVIRLSGEPLRFDPGEHSTVVIHPLAANVVAGGAGLGAVAIPLGSTLQIEDAAPCTLSGSSGSVIVATFNSPFAGKARDEVAQPRIRSPFGSNSGSVVRWASRLSPRISICTRWSGLMSAGGRNP